MDVQRPHVWIDQRPERFAVASQGRSEQAGLPGIDRFGRAGVEFARLNCTHDSEASNRVCQGPTSSDARQDQTGWRDVPIP